ncbi:MAG: LuxR C-terminal-related transcriptional regulator [Cyclobacteriaceae bacterium]
MKPLDIFVASKNSALPNYIYLFLKEFSINQEFRLANEMREKVDILIVDTDTISPNESGYFANDCPILLFSRRINPFLISYTNSYEVNGILSLDMEQDGITKTLEQSTKGEIYFNEEMISILFSPKMNELSKKVDSITARELDIVKFMLRDMTNEEIAVHLKLSVRTVNAHKGNIMRKIGAKTTSGMIKTILDYSPNLV